MKSSPFLNFERNKVSCFFANESCISNLANVKQRHSLASVLYSIFGMSRDCRVTKHFEMVGMSFAVNRLPDSEGHQPFAQ